MRPGNNTRRPRGRPNRKQHGTPRAHSYDSHGPDVRIRGNAPQIYDKYMTLARDATASGDRIAAESYYQFAEHYFRIMNDSTDPRRAAPQAPRGGPEQPVVDQEQPVVDQEQPVVDQEQPVVDWPVQADGANGDAGKGGETAEEKTAEEPAPADQEAPRRAARGRPRGRRRAGNGAKDPSEKSAAGAETPTDGAGTEAGDGASDAAESPRSRDDSDNATP